MYMEHAETGYLVPPRLSIAVQYHVSGVLLVLYCFAVD